MGCHGAVWLYDLTKQLVDLSRPVKHSVGGGCSMGP